MKKLLIAAALSVSAFSATANNNPNWDYVDVSYASAKFDDLGLGDDKLKGFSLTGSKKVADNAFVFASHISVSNDFKENISEDGFEMKTEADLELSLTSAGVGYLHNLSKTTDAFFTLSYEEVGFDTTYKATYGDEVFRDSGDESENGYGIGLGIRTVVMENVEMLGQIKRIDIDDEKETSITLGAKYFIKDNFSAGLQFNKIDDLKTTSLHLAYHF